MSMADRSGETVSVAVFYALSSPYKLSGAVMSGDFVLSFRHVCIGFIKMTSGVKISLL